MSDLELWAGAECTLNRVGDGQRDQVELTGHGARLDDVARLADLGVTTVRHPILWERTAPNGLADADWSWADARMQACRDRGLRVVAGLVHHGSGPMTTSLLDPGFVDGLAAFADAVARRYPFLRDFTPINEPLTTARFSGLYGHWYPHGRDMSSFLRALVIQIEATRAAMEAIRAQNPDARLVQTEDIGRISSTPALAYQAEYENERRWLSLDLLTGRVGRDHDLCAHLLEHGVARASLQSLVERPCPPDLVGVNYYVTSDRHLDERCDLYAPSSIGGNGFHRYADVEAVRAHPVGIAGHCQLLEEVWSRYGIPIAITESHLGCAPEEQIRWLRESWEGALAARKRGARVDAVTLWSAFGAFDWDSLVTMTRGHYEAGAFDVRGPQPRPTALAQVARELATKGRTDHPLAAGDGWWRRPERLLGAKPGGLSRAAKSAATVVVVGRGGVAMAVERACRERHLACRVVTRDAAPGTAGAIEALRPWLVVDALADVVPGPSAVAGTAHHEAVARAAVSVGARLLLVSTAHVFRGDKPSAYEEHDPIDPSCDLGVARARVEQLVGDVVDRALVVRVGVPFGEGEDRSLFMLARERRGPPMGNRDPHVSLTHLPDLAHRSLDLAVDGADGVWHLAHEGVRTVREWVALARLAHHAGPSSDWLAEGIPSPVVIQRGLRSARWSVLPKVEDALARYVAAATAHEVHAHVAGF